METNEEPWYWNEETKEPIKKDGKKKDGHELLRDRLKSLKYIFKRISKQDNSNVSLLFTPL